MDNNSNGKKNRNRAPKQSAQNGKQANKGNNNSNSTSSDQTKDRTSSSSATTTTSTSTTICNSLEQFSAKAQQIKQDIQNALEKQSRRGQSEADEPVEIVQLKNDILKLSCAEENSAQVETTTTEEDKSSHTKPTAVEVAELPKKIEEAPKTEQPEGASVPTKDSIEQQTTAGVSEPLSSAKLDEDSKYVGLVSSLRKDLEGSPGMVEPICKKLVQMSEQISRLQTQCDHYESENKKLLMIKQKLENLCRELQKSNNAIRIESLDLIKVEQGKAKEQTTKIQSTLSGVIKLFDENQQRNMALREENQELQTKLRSLLEHCDNWEKGFNAALRQREIENRLVKTELAKANLLKSEEKERFLKEKQDLLHLLSMMQEHQSRIEGQEAKLRTDLSNYASKYDECQAVISKGMSKFQTESKRMLKQMEKSKQDYKILLTKYETSNKRMAQLLEEKQRWDKSMLAANKKIETLEKLCRALSREQKDNNKQQPANQQSRKHQKDANQRQVATSNEPEDLTGKENCSPNDATLTTTETQVN